jgi:hypothetical protein
MEPTIYCTQWERASLWIYIIIIFSLLLYIYLLTLEYKLIVSFHFQNTISCYRIWWCLLTGQLIKCMHHILTLSGRRVRNRMIVGFTTICVISTYNHYSCEFEPHGEVYSIQHPVIKFVIDLQQVGGFLWYSGFIHQ